MQVLLISVALTLAIVLPSTQSDEVHCGEPPVIEFATIDGEPLEQFAVGAVITYTCQFGYTTRGKNHTLECKASGQNAEWTQPRFSCIPQSCGDPGYINNGRRIGSLFAFPNSVKYECNEGYKLKGLSTRYCQTNGLWSGKLPVCEEVACLPPQNPKNGYVIFSTSNYGSELKYKCDKGFSLNTKEIVFCTSDGKWSNTDVQCIESVCDMPQQLEYGSVQISGPSSKLLAGSLALFSCDGNRIAYGPTTSKCLETGEWTFPPPECLEPCKIPYVMNGVIGNYPRERYSRRIVFKEKTVGSKVKDEEELFLRCSERYQVAGLQKREEKISCKLGKWSPEPQCEPASCHSAPPSVQNAQPVVLNPEHGGKVLYLCDDDFKKIKNESIVCDFGTWKGAHAVCKSTRCFVDQLQFPGLLKGRKTVYRQGEVFEIECDSRYQIVSADRPELICEEGNWRGNLPPCKAASCIKPPPKIDHGYSEDHSTFHSSTLKYTCEEPYILINNYKVQCLFGEWEGQLPKCADSRCYLKNLHDSAYIDFDETDSLTPSGNKLYVKCREGYTPRSERPICLNGKWSGSSVSPCKESDCTIPILYHGDIKELRMGDYYWNWWKVRYDRQVNYVKIAAGTILGHGTTLILFCHEGYSLQGFSAKSQGIICSKGEWLPDPVCLRTGQKYIPRTTTRKPYRTSLSTKTEQSEALPTSTKVSEISLTTTHVTTIPTVLDEIHETVTVVGETIAVSVVKLPETECDCEYPINDENLIAHVDDKKLEFQDKVKNGSVVVFRCKHVGYHHLDGVQNIKCEDCRNWHLSEFPTCSEPKRGSAVIIFDNTIDVSNEGNLEARKGQSIKLMCVAIEIGLYPHWSVPSKNRVTIRKERMERESYGDVLYITHLTIENADTEDEGSYGCAVENNTMTTVNLVINDLNLRCPEFSEVDGVSVTYEMERRVKSRAVFSCTKPHQEIKGKDVLTCKKDGEWSEDFPECTDIKCKELKGNDLMLISYTNNRKVGSRATFHCFVPGQRLGESFADCLENRTWSNPIPACRTPPCKVEDISSALPENVLPDMDDKKKTVPYNTTIKLTCAEDMIVEGDPVARCNQYGKWIAENIQCVSGCRELKKNPNSTVIILPHKEVYKLGETVNFSCPPGKTLSTESQLIMCLKYGWSETILPNCQ